MPSFTLYGDVGPWPNVWLGTTVEDQARADQRIPHLLRVPAAVRFLSMEPLLERVDLTRFGAAFHGIHWAIIGGESGPGARPFHVTWARELLEQLRFAKVAAFVKQLGKVPLMDETEWRVGNERGVRLLKASNRSKSGEGMVPILLRDTKGGNWDEWPADLRVREFPR
jgi:protein gp37